MAPWNFQRFFKTLCYFGIVPVIGDAGWMQQLLGTQAKSPIPTPVRNVANAATNPAADSNGSSAIAITLLGSPSPIRDAMATAFQKALAGKAAVTKLERSPDDDTLSKTAVLTCCPDAADDWTLESVVDQVSRIKNTDSVVLFDFQKPNADMAETWGAVDDVVMGGVSASEFRLIPGAALFSGEVSTDNNGGFVSVRTRSFAEPVDISGCDGIEMRVQGDGQRYKIIVRDDARWDGVGYAASFDTTYNLWTTVRIPFSEFRPVFRARTLEDHPPLDTSQVRSLQLMLSKFEYNGELNPRFTAGMFSLKIETLGAYGNCGRSPKVALIGGSQEQRDYLQSSGVGHAIFDAPSSDDDGVAIAKALLDDN
ncbi:MAG: CIA30 family protein [Cyanobacteria bacterium P01_D01_bin.73]